MRRRDTAGQSSVHKKWRKGYIVFGQESFLVAFSFKKKVISLSMAVSLLNAMEFFSSFVFRLRVKESD